MSYILFNVIDVCVLAFIVFAAFDSLRQITFEESPWRGATFALICVGAFGWIVYDIHGLPITWWQVCMHLGFGMYTGHSFFLNYMPRRRRGERDHVERSN